MIVVRQYEVRSRHHYASRVGNGSPYSSSCFVLLLGGNFQRRWVQQRIALPAEPRSPERLTQKRPARQQEGQEHPENALPRKPDNSLTAHRCCREWRHCPRRVYLTDAYAVGW